MDISPTSGRPLTIWDQVEDRGLPIEYPQFSPPGAVSNTLPEPLLSLPPMTSEQNLSPHGQHVLTPQASSSAQTTTASDMQMGLGVANSVIPTAHPPSNTLNLHVQHWESLCRDLQKEKSVMEEQFGQQRKKFMNLMVQKDQELSIVRKSVEQFSSEAVRLSKDLKMKDEEIRNMCAATKATESANREAFDADRVKYEEEIASLRRIIDVERSEFQREREALLSGEMSGIEPRRSSSPGDPSLENEMAKAVQESKVLKAVVVPLEEEIDHLRLQLDEAKERLQHFELVQQPDTPPLIDLDTPCLFGSSPLPDSTSPSDGKLQHQLELERSARHDLEMHTKALEQQKGLLQEDNVVLKKKLDELNIEFETQQESYQQLQQTWERANQHFIVAQDKLRQQMYFMQQKHQLQKQLPQDSSQVDSHHSSDTLPHPVLPRSILPPYGQPLTVSHRSHSWSEIKEKNSGSQLETVALESELKRVRQRLEQQTTTCESYEAQLQRVQEQMLEELDEKDQELSRLREECSKARAGVMRERRAKEELRHQMEDACEQSKLQVERFQTDMQAQQAKLKLLKEQYIQTKHEAQRDLAKFSDERVSLYAQISSAQEEYDCLKVVQAEESEKYTQCISDIKKECRMAEENVVALQLRLSELQQEKQAVQESLEAQLTQLSMNKERQELSLARQLEAAKNQIAALEVVKAELGQEQHMKEEAMAARSDVEEKSRMFIAEQHRKLEEEVASRQTAEQQVRELQRQISSLRSQLNSSQENQKDFVELSQALQVKLARIEEEQKSNNSPSHPT